MYHAAYGQIDTSESTGTSLFIRAYKNRAEREIAMGDTVKAYLDNNCDGVEPCPRAVTRRQVEHYFGTSKIWVIRENIVSRVDDNYHDYLDAQDELATENTLSCGK